MRHFVVLTTHDGRSTAFPIDLIERIVEPTEGHAAKASRSGCILVCTRETHEGDALSFETWALGTVEQLVAKIHLAQEGRPT